MNIKDILKTLKSIFALDKNVVHLSGNETINGTKTFNNGVTSYVVQHPSDNKYISIFGGSSAYKGAWIELVGKDNPSTSLAGTFEIIASNNDSVRKSLRGYPNGSLTWGGASVETIEEQGSNYIRYSNGIQICWGVSNNVRVDPIAVVTFQISYNAFKSNPSLTLTPLSGNGAWAQLQISVYGITTTYANIGVYNNNVQGSWGASQYFWQAIGRWK